MFTNRNLNLFLIGTLAVVLIVVLALAVAPSAAAPTVKAGAMNPDFAQRHPGLFNPSIENTLGSDWYQRHKSEISSDSAVDTSDYYLRHPELRSGNAPVDTSDYFLRHQK